MGADIASRGPAAWRAVPRASVAEGWGRIPQIALYARRVEAPKSYVDRDADPATPPGCDVFAVELRWVPEKHEGRVDLERAKAIVAEKGFVWLDVDVQDPVAARQVLRDFGGIAEEIIDDSLTREPATQIAKYDEYIHCVMTGCRLVGDAFELDRVDVVVGQHFLLTIHKGQPTFLEQVRRQYKPDFFRFANSPSFLVYELWDHLTDNYLTVQKKFEERVERLQAALIGDVDDNIFQRISAIGADLLHLRKIINPARSVLTELSTRKTIFISEATQPFLGNMVGTLERVLQDLLVDRDILSESLNLYMSMIGHRTNRIMNKLTVVSVVFLPLTFLCGVYGMNFEVLPETKWQYGYALFWVLTAGIVAGLLYLMRKMRLL
jgi:magnesium transporter